LRLRLRLLAVCVSAKLGALAVEVGENGDAAAGRAGEVAGDHAPDPEVVGARDVVGGEEDGDA
tara:strand:+ start:632 stop:820 length:189 start_codon:yes stop_codon:yes gene_type:complete